MKLPRLIVSALCLVAAVASCKTIPAPKVPAPVTAAIDCTLPSLWAAVTVDSVRRDVAAAIQQKSPIVALEMLGESAGEAEVTCVIARENATVKMATRAEFDGGGVSPSVTQQWLDHEAAKGLYVRNFAALQ